MARYRDGVAEERPLITAAELDNMTPDKRARLFQSAIVTSLDDVPDDFRRRIEATARRLSQTARATDGK